MSKFETKKISLQKLDFINELRSVNLMENISAFSCSKSKFFSKSRKNDCNT